MQKHRTWGWNLAAWALAFGGWMCLYALTGGVAQSSTDAFGLAPIVNNFSGSILALAGAVIVGAIAFQGIMLAVRHRMENIIETVVVISVAVALILGATRIGALASSAAGAPLLPDVLVGSLEDGVRGWLTFIAYTLPGWALCRWWQGRGQHG